MDVNGLKPLVVEVGWWMVLAIAKRRQKIFFPVVVR